MTLHGTGIARRKEENAYETGGYKNHQNVELLPPITTPGDIKEYPSIREYK